MEDDKPFSMIEIFMGAIIIGSLETAEIILDPIGIGLLLTPAEIGVGTFVTLWFMYKGGSRLEARLILNITGTLVDFIPIVGMLPTKVVVFLLATHLANKAAEKDAEEERKSNKNGGENIDDGEEELEDQEEELEEEEYGDDYSEDEYYEDEEDEYPLAA